MLHSKQRARVARCFECSMANCFGLGLLYDYLAVPFLQMKVDTQLRLLERSRAMLEDAAAALDDKIAASSYDDHVQAYDARRKPAPPADDAPPPPADDAPRPAAPA